LQPSTSKTSTSCDAGKESKLQSSTSCGVDKVQSQKSQVSQQFDPFQICQQPAQPQPSLTGMKWDSDAFFDDILGSAGAGGRQGAVSLNTASMIW
jgi:hypothetical protein